MTADPKDSVIARLLTGWRPVVDPADEPGLWVGTAYYTEEPPEKWMSDAEATIVRDALATLHGDRTRATVEAHTQRRPGATS